MYSDLSKQCRPRRDATECIISSEYTLFANHLAIFRHKYGKELRCLTTEGKYGTVMQQKKEKKKKKKWYCNATKKKKRILGSQKNL